jgi:hypothetical protein
MAPWFLHRKPGDCRARSYGGNSDHEQISVERVVFVRSQIAFYRTTWSVVNQNSSLGDGEFFSVAIWCGF